MAIHPFQIGDLNFNFLVSAPATRNGGAWASEFGSVGDNINANTARYMKMLAVWADVNISGVVSAPQADSYGQGTGASDSNSSSDPWRPNGGYFVRSMSFTNTAIPPNPSGFRNGYIGTFVSGVIDSDFAHDPNNVGFVDYEAIYSHGTATFPMTADLAHQWLDTTSSPADGTDLISNNGSALTRSVYIAPAYQILHIASPGANTLGSGNVEFMVETRPSLRMAGFNDNNGQSGRVNGNASAAIGGNGGIGAPGPYAMDPIRNGAGLTQGQQNYNEFYQVTGVRKLNSRGLSFHVAKAMDNGWGSYAYPFEEDGLTLGTGITLNSPPPAGSSITPTWTVQVNNQLQYTWAGGRDKGASITATSVTSNVITITAQNNFSTGQIVLIQGMATHVELNGALLTVLASGLSSTQFEANWVHADYGTASESQGVATFNPDFRVRNAATFIINEEYYGLVMDTKCTIWSNKTSMFPLVFFDLADTWTGSTAKRIAGVAVVPVYINATQVLSYQVFFLAEDGKFARYDFTQTNGVLELAGSGSFSFAANAPTTLAAGENYGALRDRSTTSAITATSITSNVLTVTATNTFEVGEIVNITGTAESFLNNQTVQVATIIGGGTGFTAAYTHANYTNASDTGSAVGHSLWAVYGTMTPDPRTTQAGLTFTGRVGLTRYLIGTGVWSALTNFSPFTARHNGRSLSEMTVARDSKLYMLVEDVTVTGGGPFSVSNASGTVLQVNWQLLAYDPVAGTWNNSGKINGGTAGTPTPAPLQYGISGVVNTSGTSVTWVSGYQFVASMQGQLIIINGVTYTISSFNTATSLTLGTSAGSQTGVTYTYANMGGTQTTPSQTSDFWFYNINGFLIDIASNKIMIQPNWTAGTLQILDVSGSTAALANANLTLVASSTILPNDAFIPSNTNPNNDPFHILHATTGERTAFYPNQVLRTNTSNSVVYLAPPSFNWGAPTALTVVQRNSYTGGSPGTINSFAKDAWSYADFSTASGQFDDRFAWILATALYDNQIHFVRPAGGGLDGITTNATYGRSFAQTLAFLPTYWRWTGSAWTMADNFNDAFTNPKTVSGAGAPQVLPYGLNVTFGPVSGTSYSQNEFHTFNMCYGNTKWARKLRSSWAQFAGQTFVQTDTRSIASQNAIGMHLIDTDIGTVTLTAPTSQTPHTAVLTNPNLGWTTQTIWNKLDGASLGHDATPFVIVWNALKAYDTTTFAYAPVFLQTGSSPGPYSWTVNSVTYMAQASSDNVGFEAWRAFDGSPQDNWRSLGGGAQTLAIDLGSAQTVRSYGFRPVFNGSDILDATTPKSWTLEGSNTSLTAGFSTVDTQTNVTSYNRGYAVNVASPGSFRYYRMNVSTSQTGGQVAISMLRLNTLALTTTVNFSDLTFNAYGSQISATYHYPWLRNWQMARGLKFEVSTNNGGSFSPITPLWRAHNGYHFTFTRQTGITNIRITVQHGYNYATSANSGNQPQITGFGPFYLIDYNVSQVTLDAARLGNSLASPGTAAAGSFDPNCLGIATDVPNISIDGGNPSLLNVPPIPYTFENVAVHGFWDFNPVATNQFKMHPFYGFLFFEGAGPSGALSFRSGTTAVINYQWGRRI